MALPNGAKPDGAVEGRKQFSLTFWIRVEVVGLSMLIVIVLGLLTLPIIFYFIPVTVS